ncbi:MAG: MFS transporter [Clostridia bacterium]|nr:MFS transporter [Clostridia bacterium]
MKTLLAKFKSNYMIQVLLSLKGNPKACIWAEPLWGIPYNLYLPYVTLYMTALGLDYADIGLVTSIGMASQMVFAVLSGVLTDKMGRRMCTLVFDTLSWTVPTFLWMLAQDISWFIVAALFSGMWRITENSWYLLMIEDADKRQVIALNSLTNLMGLIVAFIAPLSKFIVDAFGMVVTMRVFYGFACVSMTVKFIVCYIFTTETQNGVRRMAATKNKPLLKSLWECRGVYVRIIREKRMLLTLVILAAYMLVTTLNGNYWAIYLRDIIGVQEGNVALFVTIKSMITLICSFVLVPKVNYKAIRSPMLWSLLIFAVSQGLLLLGIGGGFGIIVLSLSVILEATALSVLGPVTGSLVFINAEEDERALIVGMVYATVALIVSVFPALVGLLVEHSLRIPFWVNMGLFTLLAFVTVAITRLPEPEEE